MVQARQLDDPRGSPRRDEQLRPALAVRTAAGKRAAHLEA